MKRFYLFLMVFALLAAADTLSAASVSDENDKKEIVLTKRDIEKNIERSSFDGVMAFFCSGASEVEINCSNEGNVAIYLFNSRNQMCGYAEFDSSVMSFERINVPKESGTYNIAIITDKSYSEGSFTK